MNTRNAKRIRIVLCDDHQIIRQGLRSLLEKEPDMTVLDEGATGTDALRLAAHHAPDVVVLDVAMPDMNGITAARRLQDEGSNLKILALSMHSDMRFVIGMMEAGAAGYLLKECAFTELADAIRTVSAGGIYISPRIAGRVLQEMTLQRTKGGKQVKARLSDREQEVLQLIAEGRSTKEIASLLHVSIKTVETHRQHVMQKIGVRNVAALTKFAIREGLTTAEG